MAAAIVIQAGAMKSTNPTFFYSKISHDEAPEWLPSFRSSRYSDTSTGDVRSTAFFSTHSSFAVVRGACLSEPSPMHASEASRATAKPHQHKDLSTSSSALSSTIRVR